MSSEAADTVVDSSTDTEPEDRTLDLDVKVETTSSCGRHITVTVAKDEVSRYFTEAFDELLPKAQVPGFREGKAPRRLVEGRFKNEINDQVKGKVLMDAMTQVTTSADFAAISEPVFDFDAIDIVRDEALTFEFDIEVRPEFDVPDWKGLELERPAKDFDKKDIDKYLEQILGDVADFVPVERPAAAEDVLVVQMTFTDEGKEVSECTEEVRVMPRVSFPDAVCDGFDKLMIGAQTGDKRQSKVMVSHDAPNEALRGKELDVEIEVLDVKEVNLPPLDETTMSELGALILKAICVTRSRMIWNVVWPTINNAAFVSKSPTR